MPASVTSYIAAMLSLPTVCTFLGEQVDAAFAKTEAVEQLGAGPVRVDAAIMRRWAAQSETRVGFVLTHSLTRSLSLCSG
jgi:hypothetical protein